MKAAWRDSTTKLERRVGLPRVRGMVGGGFAERFHDERFSKGIWRRVCGASLK
jgi:hypothetical protein